MSARMLWLLLAVHQVTGGRSQAQHHQVYSNVFFSHQPQTGRPSTSFVMVRPLLSSLTVLRIITTLWTVVF